MESHNQLKLPLNANWWKEADSTKQVPHAFRSAETTEIHTEDSSLNEDGIPVLKLPKETTIDSQGVIDTSEIISPIHLNKNKEIYEEICQKLNCPKSRKFINTLNMIEEGSTISNINMGYYGLTDKGFRAMILSDLSQFSVLNLQGNIISEESFYYLISMLRESQITELNLSGMNLARFRMKTLSLWISSSRNIEHLLLRDNNFDDSHGVMLFNGISGNRSLQSLDVAQNNFSIFCGDSLRRMMEKNDTLETLDISWNHLRLEGASSLSIGLKKNVGLKTLILNWNGFQDAGARELASSIRNNDYLETLEIVSNRITDVGFGCILQALEKNTTLQALKVGWNPITQDAAEKALDMFASGFLKGSSVRVLDFSNIIFRSGFSEKINSLKEVRSDFECIYGYQDRYGKRKMEAYDPISEALLFVQSYLIKHDFNLMELFEKLDIDKSMTLTFAEFQAGLKKSKIPLSDTQIKKLFQYLDTDRDGEIDFSELVIGSDSNEQSQKN